MIESILGFLNEHIVPLGAFGVFVAAFIENAIAPIPSAVVLYTAGFLFLSDLSGFSFAYTLIFTLAIPAALGIAVGSLILYGLAYWLGKPFFEKWGKWFGISWPEIEKIHNKFSKNINDEMALGIMRAIPLFPNVALSAAAGIIRMKLRNFLLATFLGSIPRAVLLVILGAEAGVLYDEYYPFFDRFESQILIGFALLIILIVIYRAWRKRDRDKI